MGLRAPDGHIRLALCYSAKPGSEKMVGLGFVVDAWQEGKSGLVDELGLGRQCHGTQEQKEGDE
jgi:hypothetical protein